MDFIEKLQALSAKIQKQKDLIKTEEGTKTAFVLPFISALGYEIFDPIEVVPEFTADADLLGIKKGEKVDYAIIQDGKVIVLFECKAAYTNLDNEHASQIFRYFSVTEARIGVLRMELSIVSIRILNNRTKWIQPRLWNSTCSIYKSTWCLNLSD